MREAHRKTPFLIAGLVVVATAISVGVVVGGGGSSAADISHELHHARAEEHARALVKRTLAPLHHPPGHPHQWGYRATETIPAHITREAPGPYISSDFMYPFNNGWVAQTHRKFTAVDAGGQTNDRSGGAFAIFRDDMFHGKQTVDFVRVDGSGPVRIIDAPEGGGAVKSWAQRRGRLKFRGTRGVTGTLRLRDDSIRLNP
jgi:hypothetical protein